VPRPLDGRGRDQEAQAGGGEGAGHPGADQVKKEMPAATKDFKQQDDGDFDFEAFMDL